MADLIERLRQSTARRHLVQITYLKSQDLPSERVVEPYQLQNNGPDMMLFARQVRPEADGSAWRTFRLDRITDLVELDEVFEPKAHETITTGEVHELERHGGGERQPASYGATAEGNGTADQRRKAAKRRERTTTLSINFVNGYAEGWAFAVPECFKEALDIMLTPRMKKTPEGKSEAVLEWTEGMPPVYAFNLGSTLYDTPKAYGGEWSESLKHINCCLQIHRATPDNLIDRKTIKPGSVTVAVYASTPARDRLYQIGSRSFTQAEFVQVLKCGLPADDQAS